jgi:RNAse (barnase) inhibitor barstar
MNDKVTALLTGVTPPGVYQWASRTQVKTIQANAKVHGWHCVHINGRTIHDKTTFLQAFARAFHFPSYFGQNWDAFEECMRDLTWLAPAPGTLVLYDDVADFVNQDPDAGKVALAILQEVVEFWQKTGHPLVVLLRKAGPHMVNIAKL